MNMRSPAEPTRQPFFTISAYPLIALALVGFVVIAYRFLFGLGAVTNLSDGYPWGIWKAISVAAGVALATGGFTTAALVHVFHRRQFESILRLSLLVALLGYTFGTTSLLVDLGKYYNIWHPILPSMWQGDSVLFEVSMCIMIYTMILVLEFVPILCERFIGRVNLPGPLAALNDATDALLRLSERILDKVLTVFLLVGLVLSCMHHSSLGALMLVAPYKLHALWYTPVLPLLFLLSVFAVGFAAVTCVSLITSWRLGRKPDMHVLAPLNQYVFVFLWIYFIAKISDVAVRSALPLLFTPSPEALMFAIEVGLGVVVPLAMLSMDRVRQSPVGLFTACILMVVGIVINRTNVFLVAYQSFYTDVRYFPSAGEILTILGLFAAFILLFRILITVLPVLPPETAGSCATGRELTEH